MQRKAPGESLEPIPQSGKRAAALRSELQTLAQKTKRWNADNGQALGDLDPAVPGGLRDRALDHWRPLLAIADRIGGDWSEQSRRAATVLSGGIASDGESIKVQLLSDIRTLISKNGWESVTSQALCDEHSAMEERPWSDWKKESRSVRFNLPGSFGLLE